MRGSAAPPGPHENEGRMKGASPSVIRRLILMRFHRKRATFGQANGKQGSAAPPGPHENEGRMRGASRSVIRRLILMRFHRKRATFEGREVILQSKSVDPAVPSVSVVNRAPEPSWHLGLRMRPPGKSGRQDGRLPWRAGNPFSGEKEKRPDRFTQGKPKNQGSIQSDRLLVCRAW